MSRRKRFGADVEQIAQQSGVFGLEQRVVQLVRILRCAVLVNHALRKGNVLASGNALVVPAVLSPLVNGKPRQQTRARSGRLRKNVSASASSSQTVNTLSVVFDDDPGLSMR